MNERIRELALQAGAGEWGDSVVPAMMDIEKFVELIVQECAKNFAEEPDKPFYGRHVAHQIKQHFEIKK